LVLVLPFMWTTSRPPESMIRDSPLLSWVFNSTSYVWWVYLTSNICVSAMKQTWAPQYSSYISPP
jgi:hypothetical protein